MYPLGTWFVSGICVWIPCIKETMLMMIIIMITKTTMTIISWNVQDSFSDKLW